VHFNISESSEVVEKGIAVSGGMLCGSFAAKEKNTLTKVDQIIFVSAFMHQIVCSRLPELVKVSQAVISNFPIRVQKENNNIGLTQSDIISIGTLEPRKNQAFLLRTLAECNAMGKRYMLNIIGDGPDRQMLEHQAFLLGLAQQVRFLGYQPEAAGFIRGSKVFLHGAKIENLPIALLEAMQVGVPVLAAPVGGIPEIFEDSKEGYYLNLDDPRDAALKIISLLENNEKWEQMSVNAYATFADRFHQDVLGPKWISTIMGK
jgi:glycosyltransferase involved in cell wall biosynthesis